LVVAAAMVSGLNGFEDVLNANVKTVTSKAEALGVSVGMKGVDTLKHMFQMDLCSAKEFSSQKRRNLWFSEAKAVSL